MRVAASEPVQNLHVDPAIAYPLQALEYQLQLRNATVVQSEVVEERQTHAGRIQLVYRPFTERASGIPFVILDYSKAGYKAGQQPIPRVPTMKVIYPIPDADNSAHIQVCKPCWLVRLHVR